jgi:DNA invertase Pin-like site-specific DNA recombinase
MRVSTKGHGQTTDTQAIPLRQYAERRGFDIIEYKDEGHSGSRDRRPALDRLMRDARARKIDIVLVFKFDRFGRSTQHLVRSLEEFRALDIEFISLTDSVDTSTPAGKAMFGMLAVFAEFEKNLIVERVNAGLDRARKQGKQLGRRRVVVDREKVRELHKAGHSTRMIAAGMGLTKSTVFNIVNAN